jgi:hypothetical protein
MYNILGVGSALTFRRLAVIILIDFYFEINDHIWHHFGPGGIPGFAPTIRP